MEFRATQAIYLQIAEYVSEKILLGEWAIDDKIKSIRELAIELEVNPNTVQRTYDFLQQKGIIANKRGIGYFVENAAKTKILEIRKEQFFREDLPKFFQNIQHLNIDFKEIKQRFEQHKKAKNNENK